jgi:Na+/glutamate symporter
MRGWKAAAMVSVMLVLIGFSNPSPVAADSLTDGLIIGGITAGVVATVIIVAILIEGNRDPDPEILGLVPLPPARRAPGRVQVACGQPDGTRALLCW